MAESKKKFNLTIAPLWESKFGGFYTYVKDEAYDALQGVEKGGMLVIKTAKTRKNDTSPHAYLEYVTPAELAASRPAANGARKAGKAADSDDV